MCNLSDLIEERGINKGIEREIEQTILSYLEKGHITIETAAKDLGISVAEVEAKLSWAAH